MNRIEESISKLQQCFRAEPGDSSWYDGLGFFDSRETLSKRCHEVDRKRCHYFCHHALCNAADPLSEQKAWKYFLPCLLEDQIFTRESPRFSDDIARGLQRCCWRKWPNHQVEAILETVESWGEHALETKNFVSLNNSIVFAGQLQYFAEFIPKSFGLPRDELIEFLDCFFGFHFFSISEMGWPDYWKDFGDPESSFSGATRLLSLLLDEKVEEILWPNTLTDLSHKDSRILEKLQSIKKIAEYYPPSPLSAWFEQTKKGTE